jgi:hypothetical protein
MTKRRALAGGIKGDWLNDRDPTVHLKSAHVRKRESFTAREGSWAQITLPSGEVRRIPAACRATIGAVGNADHMKIRLGKAGRKRWMGRRPHVRGTAMNPNKHPMGGGEGRSKGHTPRSPTGVLAKGGQNPPPAEAFQCHDHSSPNQRALWSVGAGGQLQAACSRRQSRSSAAHPVRAQRLGRDRSDTTNASAAQVVLLRSHRSIRRSPR